INYYCIEMINNNGYIIKYKPKNNSEKNISVMKPYGVWGIISPFNFPAAIFVGMSIGAIITGNTAIVKPASNTPIIGYNIFKDSSTIKPRPIIAELGGKNPTIVTETADLDKAAEGISKAAFSYGGQKCSACSRVYVQKDIKKEFIEKLISNVQKINVENPEKKDSDLGPLINSTAFQNYKKYVN